MTAIITSDSVDASHSKYNQSPYTPIEKTYSETAPSSATDPQPEVVEESWDNWSDREVWEVARRMRESLKVKDEEHAASEKSHSDPKTEEGSPKIAAGEPEVPIKHKGFILERHHADLLLLKKTYFIVFPSIYCFDQNRIICRITGDFKYQEVDNLQSNPPELQTSFFLQDIPYWFDAHGVLWYRFGHEWFMETLYNDIHPALDEVVRCIESNNLHVASPQSPTTDSSLADSASQSYLTSPNSETGDGEFLRPLSSNPGQEEIDNWIEQMKHHRAVQTKAGERLPPVQCPLPTCLKIQRRPQALRDHLYFHYNIKPHKCDYGCNIAFETEANKNRHLETCTARWTQRNQT